MKHGGSLNNKVVTLFGGSGFLGNYVAQSLLERGARLRIASRNPQSAHSLKPLANLGQLQFVRSDITDMRSVERAVDGAHGVVNLVGAFDGNLKRLMGDAAGNMARLATQAGAHSFVQISASAADMDGETEYARAKAYGEEEVRRHFPEATIVRPTLIFGEDDDFINMFAGLIQTFPIIPVFGPHAPLQLIYVDDVAAAIALALEHPDQHRATTYELGGPDRPTMLEINQQIAAAQRRKRTFLPMPDQASAAFAWLPGTPMSADQWLMLKGGTTVSGRHPGLETFGIAPKPLGLFLDKWMARYRRHGRFADKNFGL